MALACTVKVGNVDNLSDARYCAGMGVDLLGFNLDPTHPGFIGAGHFKNLVEWVSGVRLVAEFHSASVEEILHILSDVEVDYVETPNAEYLGPLSRTGIPVILRVKYGQKPNGFPAKFPAAWPDSPAFLLLELSGLDPDDTAAVHAFGESDLSPLLLCGRLLPGQVRSQVARWGAAGIALQGGTEIRTGERDFGELAEILEELELE
jgi:phosphoribosylanthranilate isomerase